MPAKRADNRNEVKILVQSIGCTETAKQTGIPLNTVLAWSARYGWISELKQPKPLPASVQSTAISAIPPSDVLKNTAEDYSKRSKLASLKVAAHGLEYVAKEAETKPQIALMSSAATKALTDQAAKAGAWDAGTKSGGMVNITLLGASLPEKQANVTELD